MSLQGKIAIITGASSGIGAATAILFSKSGASLVLTGRNETALDEVITNCDPSSKIVKVIGDLNDETVQQSLVKNAIEKFGKLNILVNSAGIIKFGNVENMDIKVYDEIMNANLRCLIQLTQLCVPHLIESKGNIVNVSSVCGSRSFPNILAYGISKAALDQFTKSAALELAPKGVRVNSVNPGVITTGLQKRGGLNDEQYVKFLEHCKTTHALGRPGEADEVANAIEFLASEKSSFITGELIHVDGGRHAMCPR